jgi:excisionase family DNA binding protein
MSTLLNRYVTVAEAAEIIGVTAGRIRQRLVSGTIRATRIHGKAWLIPRREAERLRDERNSRTAVDSE